MLFLRPAILVLVPALLLATPSFAARCGGDFNTFVQNISAGAAAAGISQTVISQALGGVQQDMAVLNFDRRQRGTFNTVSYTHLRAHETVLDLVCRLLLE